MISAPAASGVSIAQHSLPSSSSEPTALAVVPQLGLIAAGLSGSVYSQIVPNGAGKPAIIPGPPGIGGNAFAADGSTMAALTVEQEVIAGLAIFWPVVQGVANHTIVSRSRYPGHSGRPYEPNDLAAGPDGALWITDVGGEAIDRLSPSGQITEFLLPNGAGAPVEIVAGPESSMWFTEEEDGAIGQISMQGKITEHQIVDPDSFTTWTFSGPYGITVGPDGDLWFTEQHLGRIGRMTPSGQTQEFAIPAPTGDTATPAPRNIVDGPEGNMWFTDPGDDAIGRVTPAGEVTEYATGTCAPIDIASYAENSGSPRRLSRRRATRRSAA